MQHTLRSGFSRLLNLARTHDDLPAFNAAYWLLTLLAAMLFNAGAFILLIAGHMALDVFKYRELHSKKWSKVVEGVARENVVDVSVVALGVAFAIYCHTTLPIFAGIQGLIRTEIAIVNAIVQVTVKTHVLHGFLTILADLHQYLAKIHPRMGKGLSPVEVLSLLALLASVALSVAAPWILDLDAAHFSHILEGIFVPWRI